MRNTMASIIIAGLSFFSALACSQSTYAATYSVTNTNDSGGGSLRAAITSANSSSNADTITFNIPSQPTYIIQPLSKLPTIVFPTIIDGTSQLGFSGKPVIEIDGRLMSGQDRVGLWISGSSVIIKNLAIYGAPINGIIVTNGGGNTFTGNYIGLTPRDEIVPNGTDGIGILNSPNNTIGGISAIDRNVISGNIGNGIGITGISASGNVITGNYVGTSSNGLQSKPNRGDGILVNDSPSTIIGGGNSSPNGDCTGPCNLVSGNDVNGIGLWYHNSHDSTIKGNYVGVDVTGKGLLANGDIGLEINETHNNTIGGTSAADRNIFSGNLGAGIFITGGSAYANTVIGNYIGVNASGDNAIPNIKVGLGIGYSPGIQPAHDNIIGSNLNKTNGNCDGGCNLISGNASNGILLSNSNGNQFKYNHIGTTRDVGGRLGNTTDGIGLVNSSNNLFQSNVVSGNGDNGIIVTGANSGNRFESNTIGKYFGNNGAGIMIASGADTAILGNDISGNGKLGIDLGYDNVTQNDNGDNDDGVNRRQNFPEIYAVKSSGSNYYISGTLNSRPDTEYRLEFFVNSGCNAGKPLNYGEGGRYLGGLTTRTDIYGNKVYTFQDNSSINGNEYVTATATKVINGTPAETSEFSVCRLVNTSRPIFTNGANWALKDDLTSGQSDKNFGYGFPSTLLMCAWDANQKGVKLPVVVGSNNTWYMRASYTTGVADLTLQYGGTGAKPVCGDWDGDGVDTIGVFQDGTWYLRDSNTGGAPNRTFSFGGSGLDYRPVVGDWDGNGIDGVGVTKGGGFRTWRLTDNVTSSSQGYDFNYGGDGKPVVGDWDGNGVDTIGIVYSDQRWELRNMNNSGTSNVVFNFGANGMTPLAW